VTGSNGHKLTEKTTREDESDNGNGEHADANSDVDANSDADGENNIETGGRY
jgi:hypothetical protein